jgi:hypothetical protein
LGGAAERVAGGVTESVERGDDDNGDANDQKRVLGCILTGFLAPEAFNVGEHLYGTFGTERTKS